MPVRLTAPRFVTVMSAMPLPDGAVAVIEVSLLIVKEVALTPAKATAVTVLNPDPVRLTLVPPDPELGWTALMAGRTRPRTDAQFHVTPAVVPGSVTPMVAAIASLAFCTT